MTYNKVINFIEINVWHKNVTLCITIKVKLDNFVISQTKIDIWHYGPKFEVQNGLCLYYMSEKKGNFSFMSCMSVENRRVRQDNFRRPFWSFNIEVVNELFQHTCIVAPSMMTLPLSIHYPSNLPISLRTFLPSNHPLPTFSCHSQFLSCHRTRHTSPRRSISRLMNKFSRKMSTNGTRSIAPSTQALA